MDTSELHGRSHDENTGDARLVWSVDETAHRLGISRAHAYELIARGDLPSLRLGRRIVVPVRAIEAVLG
jgi:excisionase family DNA binding protein